jgi:hypothetical protein
VIAMIIELYIVFTILFFAFFSIAFIKKEWIFFFIALPFSMILIPTSFDVEKNYCELNPSTNAFVCSTQHYNYSGLGYLYLVLFLVCLFLGLVEGISSMTKELKTS